MNYNVYSPQTYLNQQQPIFPQPNGNVYLINNSLEVANIPAGAGVTAALCSSENLLYLKTVQGGVPSFLAYKLTPYTETPKTNNTANSPNWEERISSLERQLQKVIDVLSSGGKRSNDESNVPTNAATADWN